MAQRKILKGPFLLFSLFLDFSTHISASLDTTVLYSLMLSAGEVWQVKYTRDICLEKCPSSILAGRSTGIAPENHRKKLISSVMSCMHAFSISINAQQ